MAKTRLNARLSFCLSFSILLLSVAPFGAGSAHAVIGTDFKFHRYKWDLKMKDPDAFKRRLSSYQQNHKDIDIHAESLNPYGTIFQYLGYLLAGIFGVLKFVVDMMFVPAATVTTVIVNGTSIP